MMERVYRKSTQPTLTTTTERLMIVTDNQRCQKDRDFTTETNKRRADVLETISIKYVCLNEKKMDR